MTERLYYTDAYLSAFTARVVAIEPRGAWGDRPGVLLDRSAFYPTAGGQPHDTGTLAGIPVVDVVDAEDSIVHVVDGAASAFPAAAGAEVQGSVDWARRFDHMQQHTGQHVVSAAFLRVLGAQTVSVHLGGSSTLDLAISSLGPDDARRVEDEATVSCSTTGR
jgi:alanyl-tRNA synthetase